MSELDGLPLVLTVEEVAAVLRIGRSAAYQAVRDGSIPSVRIGGRSIRVPRHQLEALLGSENGDGPAEGRAAGDTTNPTPGGSTCPP